MTCPKAHELSSIPQCRRFPIGSVFSHDVDCGSGKMVGQQRDNGRRPVGAAESEHLARPQAGWRLWHYPYLFAGKQRPPRIWHNCFLVVYQAALSFSFDADQCAFIPKAKNY